MPIRSFLLLAAICIVWSLNVIVSKLVVGQLGVPPLWFAAMRSMVVALALLPWLRPVPPKIWRVMLVTLAISGGSFALLFAGLQTASPASAAIVSLLGAPMTVVFAIVLLKEQVGWRRGVGIALTLTGVVGAMLSPSGMDGSFGLLLVAASAVLGAIGSVMLKRIDLSAVRLQAWAGVSSTLALAPLSLIGEHGQVAAMVAGGWEFIAGLAFSALVVSVGAHTLYFGLLQRFDANLIAPLTLMTPIFTIALGAWLTRDPVGPYLIGGALVALTGVLVILIRPSRKLFKPILVRVRI